MIEIYLQFLKWKIGKVIYWTSKFIILQLPAWIGNIKQLVIRNSRFPKIIPLVFASYNLVRLDSFPKLWGKLPVSELKERSLYTILSTSQYSIHKFSHAQAPLQWYLDNTRKAWEGEEERCTWKWNNQVTFSMLQNSSNNLCIIRNVKIGSKSIYE